MRYNDEERESGEGRARVERKPAAFTRKPSRQPPGRPEQNRERGYLSYNAVNTRRMTTGLGRKVFAESKGVERWRGKKTTSGTRMPSFTSCTSAHSQTAMATVLAISPDLHNGLTTCRTSELPRSGFSLSIPRPCGTTVTT